VILGRIECTYEPAMTKAFLHGRTEAIRTVQPQSVEFIKTYFSDQTIDQKIHALRNACVSHVNLTKECSKGLGQDRHLYALYCLYQREKMEDSTSESETPSTPSQSPPQSPPPEGKKVKHDLPEIFQDAGWAHLNTTILSTSNCGNPALRLFGFGPVAAEGFGIGYIIKDDALSVCATSKHLQTRRFLATLQSYLQDIQKMVILNHRQANERAGAFMDHSGVLRDVRTGSAIVGDDIDEDDEDVLEPEEPLTSGYSFFDSGEVDLLNQRHKKHRKRQSVGKIIRIAEYN